MSFAILSHYLRGSRGQAMHGGQFLHCDQPGRHRKVTAGGESLQHCNVTGGNKQQKKAVSNTVQENERKDCCNDIDVEKFLLTLKNRMVTSTKELAAIAREMAKESYVTIESLKLSSKSSNILVDRKSRVLSVDGLFF